MMRLVRSGLVAAVAVAGATLLTIPALAAPGAQAESYVALGDSYASGTGAGDYGDSGDCKRSANAYANLWANSHAPAEYSFVACSGATTEDVLNNQVSALSESTTLVTISIGGNDAGFADIITTCVLGSDSSCVNRIEEARQFARTQLPGLLDNTYATIRGLAPNAQVIVLGYPRIFTADSCWWFSDTKRTALNAAADEFSGIIAGRATSAGFTYEDVRDDFAGHEVCTSSPWINGIVWGDLTDSFHPNVSGHANGYYSALTGVTG